MKKLFLFLILVLTLISSISISNGILSDKLIHYYNLSDNLDSVGNSHFSETGIIYVIGKIGNSADFDVGDYMSISNTSFVIPNQTMTMVIWVSVDSTSHLANTEYTDIITRNLANSWMSPLDLRWQKLAGTDKIEFAYGKNGAGQFRTYDLETVFNWVMFTIVINNTDKYLYINSSRVGVWSDSNAIVDDTSREFRLGMWQYAVADELNGKLDEFGIWNRSLLPSEIIDLYNNGKGRNLTYILTSGVSPNVIINTNLVNNTINYKETSLYVNFNGSFSNENTQIVNCSIYINSVLNESKNNINLSINQNYTISFPNTEAWINTSINCSNYELNSSTITYFYDVDNINPIIQSSFINNTAYTQLDTINLYVNFTDTNLFAYNITLFDSNRIKQENYFTENLTNTFYENLTSRVATTIGNYSFYIEAWDSHTTKLINDYKIDKLNNGLEFEDKIRIYGDIKDSSYKKYDDRYSFTFQFNKTWNDIYIESNEPLLYLENSEYTLHFVDINNKKWIDFENINLEEYNVVKVNNYKYLIELRTSDKKVLTFNSIGDLNYQNLEYYYTVSSVSALDLTTTNQLLTNIYGVIDMLGIFFVLIVLIILFVVLGFLTRIFAMWVISGGINLFFAFYYASLDYSTQNYLLIITFILLFFIFTLFGIGLQIVEIVNVINKKKEQNKQKSFYIDY